MAAKKSAKAVKKAKEAEIRERIRAAGERARAEAEARRAAEPLESERPKELGGRDGPEPTRFGDWEKKGIVSDF
ncbi:MAG: DUF1674 domain-containing protein [Alphaproteobacteria bacterium]|nr:DUF1674 domain-containing protein [Alphaproteobacteria bacterium]